jgi:hypothetical protein
MFDFGEPLDLSHPTHMSQLGPILSAKGRAFQDQDFEESEEYKAIRSTNYLRCQAASINVGEGARHLGSMMHDSIIMGAAHRPDWFDIVVSDTWSFWLAADYADRVGHPKYGWRHCKPVMPIRLRYNGVRHLTCHRQDKWSDGRLIPESCDLVEKKAQEWLSDYVLFASPERIQMALDLWIWEPYRRWPRAYRNLLVVVDATRLIVHDRRRKAWRSMFGKDSLEMFDKADSIRASAPGEIYEQGQILSLFDRMGLRFIEGKSRL